MIRRGLRLAVVSLAVLGIACGSNEPIRIGVVLSLPGEVGARLAAEEVNATGGIGGRPLELRMMAEGASTLAGPSIIAAEALASDQTILAVVGHSNSSASISASNTYNSARLVQIAPTSSAPLLSSAGPYTFRLVASDIHQAKFITDAVALGGGERVAVLYVNDDYGRALHREVEARLTAHSLTPVYRMPHSHDDDLENVNDLADELAQRGPTTLIWLGRSLQLVQLLPSLRRLLPGVKVIASDGLQTSTAIENLDGALTGVRFVDFLVLDSTSRSLAPVHARFRKQSNAPFTTEAVLAYDAVMLVVAALREEGSNREAVRAYLSTVGAGRPAYAGASGSIGFDADGDATPRYRLVEIIAP